MFKVVKIEWEDPCFSSNGWVPTQEFYEWVERPCPLTISIGVVVHEEASFIVISQSFGERQIADSIKIARTAIKNIEIIAKIQLAIEIPYSIYQKNLKHPNESCDCDATSIHDCSCPYCRIRFLEHQLKDTINGTIETDSTTS